MSPPPAPVRAISHPTVASQPLAAIFTLYRLADTLARLPVWLVKALIPALRPARSWTFKQSIWIRIAYTIVDIQSTIGKTPPTSLEAGPEGARWALLPPFPDSFYRGPLLPSSSSRAKPATIGGTWYGLAAAPTNPSSVANLSRVVLHIHGGAFVTYTGRPSTDQGGLTGDVLTTTAGFDAAFFPQYRLSGYGGQDPFPAALQDSLTAYLYLVRTLQIPADRITLSGDSAGGNLAIALLRYIETYGAAAEADAAATIPKPAHLILLSPWLNPSAALRLDRTREPNLYWASDYLPDSFLVWGARAYVAQADDHLQVQEGQEGNLWVDPLHHDFATDVPLFLHWAEMEMFVDDCAKWTDKLKAQDKERRALVDGNTTSWRFEAYVEGGPHDPLLIGKTLGWDESVQKIGRQIKKFIDGE